MCEGLNNTRTEQFTQTTINMLRKLKCVKKKKNWVEFTVALNSVCHTKIINLISL